MAKYNSLECYTSFFPYCDKDECPDSYPDNSPPERVVLFRGSGPSGELSWWEIVLGIMVPVGNCWGLFSSGGELS